MKNFLFLASLLSSVAHAAPIDWSLQDKFNNEDVMAECVSYTKNKDACSGKVPDNIVVEVGAWDSCNKFGKPEESALEEKTHSAEEITSFLSRMGECVEMVNHRAFDPMALDLCFVNSDNAEDSKKSDESKKFTNFKGCLNVISDSSFNGPAFDACANAELSANTGTCLAAIKDKLYSDKELTSCKDKRGSLDFKCLSLVGSKKSDLKECSEKLADVQTKIAGLAAQSSESTLKIQLNSIVDAINHSSDGSNTSPAK